MRVGKQIIFVDIVTCSLINDYKPESWNTNLLSNFCAYYGICDGKCLGVKSNLDFVEWFQVTTNTKFDGIVKKRLNILFQLAWKFCIGG